MFLYVLLVFVFLYCAVVVASTYMFVSVGWVCVALVGVSTFKVTI